MTVGIAGASGAGKTTFAKALAARLPAAALLSTDAYYCDLGRLPPAERAAVNFDLPETIDWETLLEHLAARRAGRSVPVPCYDFKTHTRRAEPQIVGPSAATVLEGIFALWHPRVRGMLDLAVFVDTADAVCRERRIARDTAERGRTPQSVRLQWERHTLPMFRRHTSPTRRYADFIVNGEAPTEDEIRRMFASLRTAPLPAASRINWDK